MEFFFRSFSKVITIFSASNYYEIGSNKGAYLKLNPQLDTHFVQYTAAASKTRKLTFRQKVGLVESSAIRELGAKLRDRRNELEREFKARDPDNRGNKQIPDDMTDSDGTAFAYANVVCSVYKIILIVIHNFSLNL